MHQRDQSLYKGVCVADDASQQLGRQHCGEYDVDAEQRLPLALLALRPPQVLGRSARGRALLGWRRLRSASATSTASATATCSMWGCAYHLRAGASCCGRAVAGTSTHGCPNSSCGHNTVNLNLTICGWPCRHAGCRRMGARVAELGCLCAGGCTPADRAMPMAVG